MTDSEDDTPQLSEQANQALQEFLQEKELQDMAENSSATRLKVNDISEDWQLSQFWYNDDTCKVLAAEALEVVQQRGSIGLFSCPSLYYFVKEQASPTVEVKLFEIDDRFSVYGEDFLRFDYNDPIPLELSNSLKFRTFDIVILDPPFLSEECIKKMVAHAVCHSAGKIIICTARKMEPVIMSMSLPFRRTKFIPEHKAKLSNEFACFVTYESVRLPPADVESNT